MPDHDKQPGYKWRCKNFTYYNHAVNEEGTIYFAKSPCCFTILVNFVAKGRLPQGCTFRSSSGWHKGIFSEAKDGSFFCRFNCFGDEQDLKPVEDRGGGDLLGDPALHRGEVREVFGMQPPVRRGTR